MGWLTDKITEAPGVPTAPVRSSTPSHIMPGRRSAQEAVAPEQRQQMVVAEDGEVYENDGTFQDVVDHPDSYRGGKKSTAAKANEGRCPNCDSPNYFTRTQASKGKILNTVSGTMATVAPHCHDCGYNGLFDLEGEGVSGVAGQAVHAARQYESGPASFAIIGRVQ